MKDKNKKEKVNGKVEKMTSNQFSKNDPNGSYTGISKNPKEKPVQDADDL